MLNSSYIFCECYLESCGIYDLNRSMWIFYITFFNEPRLDLLWYFFISELNLFFIICYVLLPSKFFEIKAHFSPCVFTYVNNLWSSSKVHFLRFTLGFKWLVHFYRHFWGLLNKFLLLFINRVNETSLHLIFYTPYFS